MDSKETDDNGLNDNLVIILKIAVPVESDAGTSFVRVGRKFINKLNASYGDVVEITGKRKTAGVLKESPAEDENKEIIRLDEVLLYNLEGNINDSVEVRKTGKIPAKKVFLSPAEPVTISPSLVDFLKQSLSGKPVLKSNAVKVDVMGTAIGFLVSNTIPNGIVIVDKDTIFQLSEKVAKDEFQIPEVTYKDLGGLSNEVEKIREMIEIPINYPEVFGRMGIEPPKGVLLYGPPGTGKTMLVRAIANESNANFIKINGSEIMSKWFGESEKKLRDIFDEARKNAPAIIFIDEIDALAPRRDECSSYLNEFEKRIVSQLLTLMDGLYARGEIIVIGATNRPNALDPALRRPGRFDREIGIAAPNEAGRKEIFEYTRKKCLFQAT